jgi:hypothetical protein
MSEKSFKSRQSAVSQRSKFEAMSEQEIDEQLANALI